MLANRVPRWLGGARLSSGEIVQRDSGGYTRRMEEALSITGLIGSAVRVFWRLALVAVLVWLASRRAPYRYLLMHRGHGLAAVMFAFAAFAVLRWASGPAHLPAWNAVSVLIGLGLGGAALVVWGLAVIARTEPGLERRVAVGFLVVSLIPAAALLLMAFPPTAQAVPEPLHPSGLVAAISGPMASDNATPGSR